MADFVTRVVLIDGTNDDYSKLDAAMLGWNFTKVMRSKGGISYDLPQGSYFSQSLSMTSADVRNLALAATRTRLSRGHIDVFR